MGFATLAAQQRLVSGGLAEGAQCGRSRCPGVAAIRAFLTALCLIVCLTACSNDPGPDDATRNFPRDIYYTTGRCEPSVWITGVIVPPAGIQDDNGVVYRLIWGMKNTARVEYGKRYKVGGTWFTNPGVTLWACAGPEAVIPQ